MAVVQHRAGTGEGERAGGGGGGERGEKGPGGVKSILEIQSKSALLNACGYAVELQRKPIFTNSTAAQRIWLEAPLYSFGD